MTAANDSQFNATYPCPTTLIEKGNPESGREASDGCTIIRVRNGYVLDYLVPGGEDEESFTFVYTDINDLFTHLREIFSDHLAHFEPLVEGTPVEGNTTFDPVNVTVSEPYKITSI